ncbi:MAG: hypothetical protein K0R01_2694 [Mycobacterium sp.]|nr:hypothetical protein [Mycobacterium sp.]
MELTWWLVVIVACVALAAGIVVALAMPGDDGRRLRPLANVDRLTRLPAYVRAVRRRMIATIAVLVLLVLACGASVLAAARPTGLPTAAHDADTGQPEDVMVCAGAPVDDPQLAAAMRFFAGHVPTFDTQRIGLTSPNRRVIPMTRDHQYAAARFGEYAGSDAARRGDFSPAVSYANYAESTEDVLALCLTGFPDFDEAGAQRRSLIYVGPSMLRAPDETRPSVVGAEQLRELATTAGVQVNAVVTGPSNATLDDLARTTGGKSASASGDVAVRLGEIRDNPPPPTPGQTVRVSTPESPDVPLAVAVLALAALSLVPLAVKSR